MSPADFIDQLDKHQIRLQAENGQLRFFAKPGALTPELRAQIVTRKAELLAFLLANPPVPAARAGQPAILPADRNTTLPLSFAQERLWFLDQLEGPSSTYNIAEAWELTGHLNARALANAVQEFVNRHNALRTTFAPVNGTHDATQRVHAEMPVLLGQNDLSQLPEPDRRAEALRLANVKARQSFNLTTGPLLRAHLVTLGPTEYLFVFVVHHIVFDGWSADIACRELEQLYAAYCRGTPSSVPWPKIHFPDYAAWERVQLSGKNLNESLEFWQKYLQGAPTQLDIPTDFPRPATLSYRGDQARVLVAPALVHQLQELARPDHATLYHTAMTAWKILLRRYSGQTDLVVGTSVSNRRHAELESIIGFFVNTVALRTKLEGTFTVREALRLVKGSVVDALSHSDVPFERLVQEFNPKRNLGSSPIFQIGLSFQRKSSASRRFHDLELKPWPLQLKTAKFDLTLWLTDTPEGLRAALEYATDLFSRGTAERMLGHYHRILEEMAARPDTPIDQLRMTTAAEEQQILVEWNRTGRDYPRDRCLHELFEAQARQQPGATAVVFGGRTLTYAELDRQAARLAALLRTRGVGPDVLVGLCVERSFDMLVGILGILKAGGAYVPIDPAYPADRIAFVLEDSRAPVLVTQRPLLAQLPSTTAFTVLLDEPLPAVDPAAKATPVAVTPAHLAYVLYTSGSTGKPKGVQIPHGAVVNFLNSMRREPGLAATDVLLAVTTLSFDIAGLELHLPLTTGAKIILAPRDVATDGRALLDAIDRHKVTVLQATPATWRLMLASGWKGTPRLKALCGGEALPADLTAEMLPRCAELWNMYGPTETTIWSTCARVTAAADIHIGRPIDNTEIYILDAHQQPLPIGLPGELLIGGDGLARGYHNRPDLTADRFIPHPFRPGARLYRSGDLARYRADGTIHCLGRLDFQVKIRGFRIELGEIETQLAAHPEVKHNVVVAREDTPGDKRLVAYYVARPGATPADAALRDHLRGKLPEYMLPAAFVLLEALPLTPNGKIDRQALPAPNATAAAAPRDAIAPRNPTEERLAAIFQKILGAPVASVTDNFFDLGGHSLMAARMMAIIEQEFGRRLPLVRLFDSPTIEGLAAILSTSAASDAQWDSLVPIRAELGKPALFLIHGAGGNVLLYREVAKAIGDDFSVYGFQSQGLDRRARPLSRVEDMAAHYVKELRTFQPEGPYHLGGYCMGGTVAYEMARLLEQDGATVGLVALLDTYNWQMAKRRTLRGGRFSALRQKTGFHLGNLRQLSPKELFGYFVEKFRMARELGSGRISTGLSNLRNSVKGTAEEAGVEVFIQEVNHAASWDYVPRPFGGRITVFRPQKNYDFFPDPKMGWSGLMGERLEVIELPVNPHAMLVQPCVTRLAGELAARIRRPAGKT